MTLFGRLSTGKLVGLLAFAAAAATASGVALARRAQGVPGSAAKAAGNGVVVIETDLGFEGGRAAGTGMVLTPSGEVLTNNHVIDGATSVKVIVPQTGRSYTGQVLGYDISADTALVKLDGASGLATITSGDSSKLVPGRLVRAVGNAGGTGTLTTVHGQVTGLRRTITVSDDRGATQELHGLIETDAALQPGDSGGPLFVAAGRVVGMDTAVSTAGHGFFFQAPTDDAFAIPINAALRVVKQIESGRATAAVHVGPTAYLGVELGSAGAGYGYGFGFGESGTAVLVAGVVSGSPADRAGLTYGDEIVSIDGRRVASPKTVVAAVLRKKPSEKVTLTWSTRGGSTHTARIALGSGPPQ